MFKKPYWRPNKESRKLLRKTAENLIGYNLSGNPTWKDSSWKFFAKRQFPWGGIIELNQFKITEMKDYLLNHSGLANADIEEISKQMTEVLDLGNRILEDEYSNAAHLWFRENTVGITLIYKRCSLKNLLSEVHKKKEIGKLYNTEKFEEIKLKFGLTTEESSAKHIEMLTPFLKGKDIRKLPQWLKDNKLTEKDIVTAYTSEWINGYPEEVNVAKFKEMLDEAEKDRLADISKYFECIGDYLPNWRL